MRKLTMKEQMNQLYNSIDPKKFIAQDPIQIVRTFMRKPSATTADVEISAMWTAMLSWDNNQQTIQLANKLMTMCENCPADFVKYGGFYDIPDDGTIYRTLSNKMFKSVNHTLRAFYNKYESVQAYIATQKNMRVEDLIMELSDTFAPARLGSPVRNSACKRICLLLRWMVRKGDIDIGLWRTDNITPARLYAVMSSVVAGKAKKLGLITYDPHSWRAVLELSSVFRQWNIDDPLRYDIALSYNNN